jgi:hypothetical protein
MYWYNLPAPATDAKKFEVTHVSGKRIEHRDIRVDAKSISFRTIAEGKGEALVKIDKTIVPEAREWMNRVHAIQATVSLEYNNGFFSEYGVMYWRRMGRLAVGAGARGSARSAAIEAGVMILF